jgi:hypothetical protein
LTVVVAVTPAKQKRTTNASARNAAILERVIPTPLFSRCCRNPGIMPKLFTQDAAAAAKAHAAPHV